MNYFGRGTGNPPSKYGLTHKQCYDEEIKKLTTREELENYIKETIDKFS